MAPTNVPTDFAYDVVGRYQQDEVNGFTREHLIQMIAVADLPRATAVLDAMAGDGILTRRMAEYCRE